MQLVGANPVASSSLNGLVPQVEFVTRCKADIGQAQPADLDQSARAAIQFPAKKTARFYRAVLCLKNKIAIRRCRSAATTIRRGGAGRRRLSRNQVAEPVSYT